MVIARPTARPRPGQASTLVHSPDDSAALRADVPQGVRATSEPGSSAGAPSMTPSEPMASAPPSTASEVFDAILRNASDLYRGHREILRESYVPPRLPHREHQIQQVAEVLGPALRGDLPSNLLIYGKIGTGKTAVVTQVRQDLQRRSEAASKLTFV